MNYKSLLTERQVENIELCTRTYRLLLDQSNIYNWFYSFTKQLFFLNLEKMCQKTAKPMTMVFGCSWFSTKRFIVFIQNLVFQFMLKLQKNNAPKRRSIYKAWKKENGNTDMNKALQSPDSQFDKNMWSPIKLKLTEKNNWDSLL